MSSGTDLYVGVSPRYASIRASYAGPAPNAAALFSGKQGTVFPNSFPLSLCLWLEATVAVPPPTPEPSNMAVQQGWQEPQTSSTMATCAQEG